MTIFLAAALLALSTGCTAWLWLHNRDSQSLISSRLANANSMSFPYTMNQGQKGSKKQPSEEISLSESFDNKLVRQLYLAGFRTKKSVPFFNFLFKLSYALPAFIIAAGVIQNERLSDILPRAFIIGFAFSFVTRFMIRNRRQKLIRQMSRTLPQLIDLLVISIEAGMNFTAALPRVLRDMDQEDPLIKEFQNIHHEYLGGLSMAEACERASKRCDLPELSVITSSIVESEQNGSSLARVLRIQAIELRDKYRQRLRERAHKIPVKLLFPMMLVFLTIFIYALGPSLHSMKNNDIMKGGSKKAANSSPGGSAARAAQ